MRWWDDRGVMDASKRTSAGQRPAGRLTRKRIPLSCVACRIRKYGTPFFASFCWLVVLHILTAGRLKCNREKPCQNCIVRGDAIAAACSYAEKADGKVSKSSPRSDAEDMRKRINRLESSIRQMMSSTGNGEKAKNGMPSPVLSNTSTQSTETPDSTGGQRLSVDTRSTHWDAILDDASTLCLPLPEIPIAWADLCVSARCHERCME